MAPAAILEEVTEASASWREPIAPSTIIAERTASSAIAAPVTALRAMLSSWTAPRPMCVLLIARGRMSPEPMLCTASVSWLTRLMSWASDGGAPTAGIANPNVATATTAAHAANGRRFNRDAIELCSP